MSAFDELVEDEHEPCALLMAGLLRALSGGNSLWFSMRYPFLLEVGSSWEDVNLRRTTKRKCDCDQLFGLLTEQKRLRLSCERLKPVR